METSEENEEQIGVFYRKLFTKTNENEIRPQSIKSEKIGRHPQRNFSFSSFQVADICIEGSSEKRKVECRQHSGDVYSKKNKKLKAYSKRN
jgi:hypothetical protein